MSFTKKRRKFSSVYQMTFSINIYYTSNSIKGRFNVDVDDDQ